MDSLQSPFVIRRHRHGFTLVEVLVVLFILLTLAAIALPTAKNLIADQKASRTARNIIAYFETARARAIATEQPVGVAIQRLRGDDEFGRAVSLRLVRLTGVPPYAGDTPDAKAFIDNTTTPPLTAVPIQFEPRENQLLTLSASLVADPMVTGDTDDLRAPIRNNDRIELPGGRIVPFTITHRALTEPDTVKVILTCNLFDPIGGTQTNPVAALNLPSTGLQFSFRIHRRPATSSHDSLELPRGSAIDLNYSGVGERGNGFAPSTVLTDPVFDVGIVFDSTGRVASVSQTSTGVGALPAGQIFLCLGKPEGVRPDSLFSTTGKQVANLLDPKSIWLTLNPSSGAMVASPVASITAPTTTGPLMDPTLPILDTALADSRFFAILGDTIND